MVSVASLRELCFLQNIAEEHLTHLASIAEVQEFAPNSVIFREGDAESHVYLVADGRVGLEIKVPSIGSVRLHTVGVGELLGWSPLLGTGRMTATARAITSGRLIALRAAQILVLCEHNPRLGVEFMRRTAMALAQRLSGTRLQLLDVYRHELPVVSEQQE